MHRNFVAFDGEEQRFVHSSAHYTQVHGGAFLASEALHDLSLGHLHARYGSVVDADDAVAGHYSHLLRRAVDGGLDYYQRVFNHVELHANALEVALQRLGHGLGFLCVGVGGVRVELFEHTPDGVFNEFCLVNAVYVELADGYFGHLQLAQWVVVEVELQLCRACGRPQQGCQKAQQRCL